MKAKIKFSNGFVEWGRGCKSERKREKDRTN